MNFRKWLALPMLAAALLLLSVSAFAAPVGPDKALLAVQGWLAMDPHPMGVQSSMTVGVQSGTEAVQAFADESGSTAYYVVTLSPSGFAVVSADDLLEPIVAF